MPTIYRFLALEAEASMVLDWFRSCEEESVETPHEAGRLFFFRQFGSLESDASKSPLVNVFLPVRKRGVLTTIGEVHFLATPLSRFPGLKKINKRFRDWLGERPCVFSRSAVNPREWDYYLEGSARNWDSDIFALPAAMAALRSGSYFVSMCDNDQRLDLVCRSLQMRGVEGIQSPSKRES
jgi:hypothetical protein